MTKNNKVKEGKKKTVDTIAEQCWQIIAAVAKKKKLRRQKKII